MNSQIILDHLFELYPGLLRMDRSGFENIRPGLSAPEIAELEKHLEIVLPVSFKKFLSICSGFNADGIKLYEPFFHEFNTHVVAKTNWPPPSQGMLCFTDTFFLADGDQSLFDVSSGLSNGEYPIVYYDHERDPAIVIPVAQTFEEFLNEFLPDGETSLRLVGSS
ncbi:MAG: SMI1/KNR4 family protein [Planctomycetes bacterium]|nr:SMI1/KNR4 family protein [Planctomycetota bacterium]